MGPRGRPRFANILRKTSSLHCLGTTHNYTSRSGRKRSRLQKKDHLVRTTTISGSSDVSLQVSKCQRPGDPGGPACWCSPRHRPHSMCRRARRGACASCVRVDVNITRVQPSACASQTSGIRPAAELSQHRTQERPKPHRSAVPADDSVPEGKTVTRENVILPGA